MIRIKCRRNSVKMYVKSDELIISLEKFSLKLKNVLSHVIRKSGYQN